MRRVLLPNCLIILLVNILCSDGNSPYKSIRVSNDSSGSTLLLNVGDTLVVSLKSNVITGYSWYLLKIDTAKIELLKSSYIQDKPVIPGAEGTEVFQYVTKENTEGETTELRMAYAEVGSQNTTLIDSFKVNLEIEYMMPD